ncbi:MAG: ABC transporter substrate-binding protein [Sphaerochaetaceae bacterium]|nr:ABC transporter substrate-binding protein [Sphaerochaetaceae bacterium]MDD3670069.1 ABC transporter substrate-binding protein [Sphaerochaetaceae bacterium]MDD4842055.1 ABC transporter substrate-binding protein [Sphaerochaetaceae bacterium]
MRKFLILFVIMVLVIAALPAAGQAEPPKTGAEYKGVDLVVATWGWTAANVKKLSEAFEKQYGCTVIIDETSGNADRLNKVIAQQKNPEIDVVMMSESFSAIGNDMGVFEKIDTNIVTNLNNLYDFAKNADGYGPAYSLVRYGILYDKDRVPAPASYLDLFNGTYDGMLSLPDMTSTAGPYLLVAIAEALGGSAENVDPAFDFLKQNVGSVAQFYTTSSDVQTGFTTGEIAVSVFMDMNMPMLAQSGINIDWVDAKEGSFSAAATINVVKGAKNPTLAQLYVNYLLSDEIQNQLADVISEAPTSKNAIMSAEKQKYLAFGEDAVASLRAFDWAFINDNKADWIYRFQKDVTSK